MRCAVSDHFHAVDNDAAARLRGCAADPYRLLKKEMRRNYMYPCYIIFNLYLKKYMRHQREMADFSDISIALHEFIVLSQISWHRYIINNLHVHMYVN